ncbi:tetratricopeptide repeat protein [Caulobacter sp. KR2-114]|uniref:tetratricopeptide repeat protein n=1 Tax=Caulobacter sp. KR2-114 TaxID=3400912 RepID=UPI003BFFADF8
MVRDRVIALYGRFSPGGRERLQGQVLAGGGTVARDLTRRSGALVVGAQAWALVDGGALVERLAAARERGLPAYGERSFAALLADDDPRAGATAPLATALAQSGLGREDAEVLAAFDLITLARAEGGAETCRFGDPKVMRAAADLLAAGRTPGEVVRLLGEARDKAPVGRHRVVPAHAGAAALQWDDGRTTLEGQGLLPLDEDHASLDDLFEAATLAEVEGDDDRAARLYDLCARADRTDPIAPYNFGNIRLGQGAHDEAAMAYRRALARDARFAEARYNLAQALEAAGRAEAADAELSRLLELDPGHADAVFNLAQLRLKADDLTGARALFERYLALDPPDDWAATAHKAIAYCQARLPA